jgi:hypothetical protein
MKSKEVALTVRHQFAAKRRVGGSFRKTLLGNSVTLATRVRIEIRKAMAKQYVNECEIA